MRGRRLLGGVILSILFLGLIYGVATPFLYDPGWVRRREWTPTEGKVITHQELSGEEAEGVEKVDLNVKVRSGGVTCNFTDSPYAYRFIFRTDVDASRPLVYHSREGDALRVDVILDNGDAKLFLSENYLYNGSIEWGVGGLQLTLNEHTRIDGLQLRIRYLGFISLDIRDKAMFNQLDVDVNTGGMNLRVDAETLYGRTMVEAALTVGGILVPSLTTGPGVGVKASMNVDIGGLNLGTTGFKVHERTLTSAQLFSTNYESAASRLDLAFTVGFGGVSFNLPPYQISPGEFAVDEGLRTSKPGGEIFTRRLPLDSNWTPGFYGSRREAGMPGKSVLPFL